MVKFLLNKNTDPNIPNKFGIYPLRISSSYADLKVVNMLLRHKADID